MGIRERIKNAVIRVKQQVQITAKGAVTTSKSWFSDKGVQVATAAGATGSVAGGVTGGAFGVFVGGAVGATLGLLPAIFTFGLSIPTLFLVGSGCGAAMGSTVGGATGFVGGGAVGYGAYAKRDELRSVFYRITSAFKDAAHATRSKAQTLLANGKSSSSDVVEALKSQVKQKTGLAVEVSKKRLNDAKELAADRGVQVVAVSATGGAVVAGTAGSACGLAVGSTVGAAVGVVPAFFTFGLSIPVFAAVGGGCGMVAGTTLGAASGLLGGGMTGYVSYTRRDAISNSMSSTLNKVDDCKKKVLDVADSMRHRLVGGTGGTMD